MRQIWMLEKLNFKISRGNMPPDPPSVLAPLALDSILAGPTLNCFRRACNHVYCKRQKLGAFLILIGQRVHLQGPRSNFEIWGGGGGMGGTISAPILGGGHKTFFLANSL